VSEKRRKAHHRSYEEKSLIVRYALEHRDKSVDEVAASTGVERSALYRWLKRVDWDLENLERLRHGGLGRRRTSDQAGLSEGLQEEIRGLLDAHADWGPLKIKHYFWRHRQVVISQRRIYRFLKEEGVIEARRRRPKEASETARGERRFEAPAPLGLVQMDCMRLELSGGQVVWLVTLLDDYSRFILRSRFVAVKTMESVMAVFREGIKEWGVMEKVLTDQGSEFVSWQGFTRFEELLVNLDVELVVAASKHPETLGKLERFHETLRAYLRERGPVEYGSQAQLVIGEFVPYYNYERPHEALGGLVPADRFYGVSAPLEAELNEYRKGRREGQQLYMCCRIGGRRIVLSGPRTNAVQMYANGKRLSWEDEAVESGPGLAASGAALSGGHSVTGSSGKAQMENTSAAKGDLTVAQEKPGTDKAQRADEGTDAE